MSLDQAIYPVEKLEDAQNLIAREDADVVQSNLDYYYGDHWQNMDGWAGPIPQDSEDYDTVVAEIVRGFTSKNVVKEITDRAANAVSGRKPVWDVVPNRVVDETSPITSEEEAQIKEAKLLLKSWMEDKEFHKYLSKALRQTLMAGSSTLRLFVPAGFLVNGVVQVDTNKPVEVLEFDAPTPLEAGIAVEPNSREKMAVFLGQMGTADKPIETAEISYLLPERTENGRITEITLMVGQGDDAEMTSVQLDLGGRLPVFQMEMPRLVTQQVVSLQKGINLNLSMMVRNSLLGGFLERVITNGQMPGHYDDDGNFVRDEMNVGAGSVTAISGIPIIDPNTGEVSQYTTADMRYRDPVTPDTFLKGATESYRMILEASDQLHALISGDAAASGESRRQAVASFFGYLRTPKQEVDKAGRWALETVLAYAGLFSGNAGKFNGLRVNYESKLDMGAVPTSEIDLVERLVNVGILSLETGRERVGVDDPEAEARRVEAEAGQLKEVGSLDSAGNSKVTGQPLQNVDNNDITAK